VNYLCDGNGLMQLRSRTMQLRLLDKVKLRETGKIWQLVNVAFPVIMIVAGGVVFQFLRRRRSRSFLK
jgi:ABC-2 type transport system permease protein